MESQREPLSLSFNIAVEVIARKLFPCGFDVVEEGAPNSLEELNEHIALTGRMAVWAGEAENTVMASPEINYSFRAWHDWCHWKGQHPFTVCGEVAVCGMQQRHLREVYGDSHPDLATWDAILWAEVVEQAQLHAETGAFPEDQRGFTEALVQQALQS